MLGDNCLVSKGPGNHFSTLSFLTHNNVFYLIPIQIIKCLWAIQSVSFFQGQLVDSYLEPYTIFGPVSRFTGQGEVYPQRFSVKSTGDGLNSWTVA